MSDRPTIIRTTSSDWTPIDVGYDLRTAGTAIHLPAAECIRVRFLDAYGRTRDQVGTPEEVAVSLIAAGFTVAVDPKTE